MLKEAIKVIKETFGEKSSVKKEEAENNIQNSPR